MEDSPHNGDRLGSGELGSMELGLGSGVCGRGEGLGRGS